MHGGKCSELLGSNARTPCTGAVTLVTPAVRYLMLGIGGLATQGPRRKCHDLVGELIVLQSKLPFFLPTKTINGLRGVDYKII